MAKMNKEIVNGYLEGKIAKSTFLEEYHRVYGGGEVSPTPIRKSSDKLLQKAVDENDNESYVEWNRRDAAKTAKIKKASYDELAEVTEEFNRMLSQTIRKENETKEMVANRIWMEKSSTGEILYDRYQRCMRNITI